MKRFALLFLASALVAFAQAADLPVSANVGQTITMTVSVQTGSSLAYQWSKGAAPIAGATNYQLVLAKVALTDAGTYSCRVSNPSGSTVSNNALVTVIQPPPPLPAPSGASLSAAVTGP